MENEVQITTCGSLGLCESGPNIIVYPEGTWYSGVTPEDFAEVVQSRFQNGKPVVGLVRNDVAGVRTEILQNREKMAQSLRAREAAGVPRLENWKRDVNKHASPPRYCDGALA